MGRPHRHEQKALREEFLLKKPAVKKKNAPGGKASGAFFAWSEWMVFIRSASVLFDNHLDRSLVVRLSVKGVSPRFFE